MSEHRCSFCGKKVGSRVPQPSLDFTKETAGAVLGEECRRLAAEATTLCEQLVGDILWGGLAQERVAHKIRLIQLLWLCRARLAGTMRLARASKFDAVPDLVEQANVVRQVDSVEKLGDCADARRAIEKIEEQVRILRADDVLQRERDPNANPPLVAGAAAPAAALLAGWAQWAAEPLSRNAISYKVEEIRLDAKPPKEP